MLSHFTRVWLFATLWTVAHQALLSMGILQARILEWVAISSSRGSSWPRDQTHLSCISCIAGAFFTCWAIHLHSSNIGKCHVPGIILMSKDREMKETKSLSVRTYILMGRHRQSSTLKNHQCCQEKSGYKWWWMWKWGLFDIGDTEILPEKPVCEQRTKGKQQDDPRG